MNSSNDNTQQHVLILGATGFIGSAVANELIHRGHIVTGLARSDDSEQKLRTASINVLRGDIRKPQEWVEQVKNYDAIIQTAITWDNDMAEVDQHLIRSIIKVLTACDVKKTLIYTGGCWAYGNTGLMPATEESPYDPTPEFSWMVDLAKEVDQQGNLYWNVVHPAMVYQGDDGVLETFIEDAKNSRRIRIIGDEQTCWTMVDREDLAELYALVLEQGENRHHYNGASVESVNLTVIASALARRFNITDNPEYLTIEQALPEWGDLANGYALSQAMSSEKAIKQLGWQPKHTDILTDIS